MRYKCVLCLQSRRSRHEPSVSIHCDDIAEDQDSRMNCYSKILRDSSGATAVEFAIVVPVLLCLIFSTFEAGWMVTKSTMLDRALDTVVRKVRVGASGAPTTQD